MCLESEKRDYHSPTILKNLDKLLMKSTGTAVDLSVG